MDKELYKKASTIVNKIMDERLNISRLTEIQEEFQLQRETNPYGAVKDALDKAWMMHVPIDFGLKLYDFVNKAISEELEVFRKRKEEFEKEFDEL